MEMKTAPSLKNLEIIMLSFFGIGFLPYAPGTFGSLAAIPLLYTLTYFKVPWVLLLPFILVTTAISSFLSEYVQKKFNCHDPQWIVIDEVLGMMVAWLFISDGTLIQLLIMFILFRFFDIIKFWPASYFDKKVKHGTGIIIDDLVSGVYAGITYCFFEFLIEKINLI